MLGQCFPKHLPSNSDPGGCFLGTGTIVKRNNLFQNISNEYSTIWHSCPFPLFSLAFSKLTRPQTTHLSTTHTFHTSVTSHEASLMAQQVKNLPAMQETQETWVQSLVGRPLGRYGNLLQYSCLENPTDRRAGWATVHGVTKNQTRLKGLSRPKHKS